MDARTAHRTFRRLIAAEGYLQLGMPDHALLEIDAVEVPGPFEPPMHFMRGEALRAKKQYAEAIVPLQMAAKTIPAPYNKHAWMALSDCLRQRGQTVLADVAAALSEARRPEAKALKIEFDLQLALSPTADESGT